MQKRHHLLTLSKGMQADTTNYFVVWWVLFEYSSFDHFPNMFLFFSRSKIGSTDYKWVCLRSSCHSMGLRAVYQRFVKNLGNERVTQIVDKRKSGIKEHTFFELLYVICIYFTN